MKIFGLTGSIGMGKTETAKLCQQFGGKLFDADKTAHALTRPKTGLALPEIQANFPEMVQDGHLNRQALAKLIFADEGAKKCLENILHPMIANERDVFLFHARRLHIPFVILDIPLLFEANLDYLCDRIMVVHAPYFIQRQRVLSRANMDECKFKHILQGQMPNEQKIALADYVIPTNQGRHHTRRVLYSILKKEKVI